MFTGIIEELGSVGAIEKRGSGARISISAEKVTDGTAEGDSISVNGVCLTALKITGSGFEADVSKETLECSTLGSLNAGSRVNLERAVTPSTRLGGHVVQGHVDGTGSFVSANEEDGDFWTVKIAFPPEIAKYLVHKGSVAVEGISLTIAAIESGTFDIAVIPKTWDLTNLSQFRKGDAVNLEVDIFAKYVERMLEFATGQMGDGTGITVENLKKLGIVST